MRTSHTTNLIGITSTLLTLGFLAACGSKGGSSSGSSSDAATQQQKIPISMSVTQNANGFVANSTNLGLHQGLGLAGSAPGNDSVTTFTMNLSGCASGLSGNAASSTVMNVYLGDTSCIAKLTALTWNSTVYNATNAGATNFSSWAVGQTATFASSGGALIYLKVISQLSSPIVSSDFISYEFTFNNLGTNSNGTIAVSNTASLYVAGTDAPVLSIPASGISVVGFAASATPQIQVTLNCANPMVAGPSDGVNKYLCPTVAAGSIGLEVNGSNLNMEYKLIADPLNASSHGTLTLAQAQAAFASAGTTTYSSLNAGGIVSSTLTSPLGLTGSVQYLILVVQEKNLITSGASNASYQYFALTLPAAITP